MTVVAVKRVLARLATAAFQNMLLLPLDDSQKVAGRLRDTGTSALAPAMWY